MKVIYKSDKGRIIHGDNLEALDKFPENSVDSCISDFPYAIEFMGKNWDSAKHWNTGEGSHGTFEGTGYTGKKRPAFYQNTNDDKLKFYDWCFDRAEKLHKIIKPGGYVCIFGHPKTNHRMKCAFEDAGFNVVEEIEWVYLCVSEDTEILTQNGWKTYKNISKTDKVMTLNTETNLCEWQEINEIFIYDYDGNMKHIKTIDTDQLITPNHRILYKPRLRKMQNKKIHYYTGDWKYDMASSIKPYKGLNLPLAARYEGNIEINENLAYLIGIILSEGHFHRDCDSISIYQSSVNDDIICKIKNSLNNLNIQYSEYTRQKYYNDKANSLSMLISQNSIENYKKKHGDDTYIEYQFYLGVKESKLFLDLIPEKFLTMNILEWTYDSRLKLFEGLIDGDGSFRTNKYGNELIQFYQKDEEFRVVFQLLCFSLGYKTSWNENKVSIGVSKNSFTQIQSKYFNIVDGIKELPEQYYKGKVWCVSTDNTNFVARRNNKIFITGNSGMPKNQDIEKLFLKKDKKEMAERWSGFKTSGLKPAHEPITIFQKPLEGTYIQNIEKWNCGGMNIDACRVPVNPEVDDPRLGGKGTWSTSKAAENIYEGGYAGERVSSSKEGRFPPNMIFDEFSKELLDEQTGIRTSGSNCTRTKEGTFFEHGGLGKAGDVQITYGDSGVGSRMFPIIKYCTKVSPKERKLPNGERNPHVTLKPVELIKWLIKLVTPKNGKTIDITAGSCTHAVASEELNRDEEYNLRWVDIELMNTETEPYCDVGKMRVEAVHNTN